jgi:hypothetical protein
MPRERDDIEELLVRSIPSNVRKALKLREKTLFEKREVLEKLFEDLTHTYERASDDVRIRGSVITVTRFSNGIPYEAEIVNPYFQIMAKLTAQMSDLAKVLSKFEKSKKASVIPGSFEDLFPDIAKDAS